MPFLKNALAFPDGNIGKFMEEASHVRVHRGIDPEQYSAIGAPERYAVGVSSPVPQLLESLRAGDKTVVNALVTALYSELHRIAARHLRQERPSHTLQTTALVHEAYLKLVGGATCGFADRAHFLAVASRVMRQILVDYARSRNSEKRGGREQVHVPETEHLHNLEIRTDAGPEQAEILDLDRALEALSDEDQSLARLIEMRYFGGMTAEETAEALGQSVHIVRHDLRLAQAWMRRKLSVKNDRPETGA